MEVLETQVETGRWQYFVLWCRWHWHHGPTSFPENDQRSINFLETQRIAERRLTYAARVVQRQLYERLRLENKMRTIDLLPQKSERDMSIYLRHQQKWLGQEKRINVSRSHYNRLWNLYAEIGLIHHTWGNREHFLQSQQPNTSTARPPWLIRS